MVSAVRKLFTCDLSSRLVPYGEGFAIQKAISELRIKGLVPDTIVVLQHSHVYTVGKRGRDEDFLVPRKDLQAKGVDIFTVPRGGEVTYHGPGQVVMYPIVSVRGLGLGARRYVEGLEDVMINTAGGYGIKAHGRVPGQTGVWVQDRKLGAVGVRISQGVSTHGIALNATTDLSFFKHVVPCGQPGKVVTSLEKELGWKPSEQLVARQLLDAAAETFGYNEQESVSLKHLLKQAEQPLPVWWPSSQSPEAKEGFSGGLPPTALGWLS